MMRRRVALAVSAYACAESANYYRHRLLVRELVWINMRLHFTYIQKSYFLVNYICY